MSNWLQKIFRRKIGVKTLDPGVKFLLGHCVLCVVAYGAASYAIFSDISHRVVDTVNPIIGVISAVHPMFTCMFRHGRFSPAIEAVSLCQYSERLFCKPEFQRSSCSAVEIRQVEIVKHSFSGKFSARFACYARCLSLEASAALRLPVRDDFSSTIAFKSKQSPTCSAWNRIIRVSRDFFNKHESSVAVSRLSFNFCHNCSCYFGQYIDKNTFITA